MNRWPDALQARQMDSRRRSNRSLSVLSPLIWRWQTGPRNKQHCELLQQGCRGLCDDRLLCLPQASMRV